MIAASPTRERALSPAAQWEEYLACKVSRAYFIDTYCKIQHPARGTIPFQLFDWQFQLLDLFAVERLIIALKSRQIGFTELCAGNALWEIRFHPSKTALALSKTELDAQKMKSKAAFMHRHLPSWLQAGSASLDGALLGRDNTSVLEIIHKDDEGHDHPSVLESLTASENTGRSASASLVMMDEWAFQQFAETIWAAIQPTAEYGQIIGFSTANGLGNLFHRIWEGALKKENNFYPVFLPWWKRPGRDQAWYEAQKKELITTWRLHQEHPSNASEAFIQTGRPVFEPEIIDAHAARLEAEKPFAVEEEQGLTIYEWPTYDWRTHEPTEYILAADVAEGLDDGDYDAAVVLNRATGEEVAELRGQWAPEDYAAKLDKLGVFYHYALLAVERNNHGHAVILALRTGVAHKLWTGEEARYPKLYYHEDATERNGKESSKPGWPTTQTTKPLMVDKLGAGLRDMSYRTRSRIFLSEAKLFAHLDGGGMGAPRGYHDDTVICRCIAWFLFTTVARRRSIWVHNPQTGRLEAV